MNFHMKSRSDWQTGVVLRDDRTLEAGESDHELKTLGVFEPRIFFSLPKPCMHA